MSALRGSPACVQDGASAGRARMLHARRMQAVTRSAREVAGDQRAAPSADTMSRRKPGARMSRIGFSGGVGST